MKLTRAALSQWWNRAGRSVAEQSALVELLNEPGTGPEVPIAPGRMTPELWTAVRERAAQIEHEARAGQADAPFKEADRLAEGGGDAGLPAPDHLGPGCASDARDRGPAGSRRQGVRPGADGWRA